MFSEYIHVPSCNGEELVTACAVFSDSTVDQATILR